MAPLLSTEIATEETSNWVTDSQSSDVTTWSTEVALLSTANEYDNYYYDASLETPQWYRALMTFTLIIAAIASFLNIMTIVALTRSSSLRSHVNEIVISLALADALFAANIPLHVIDIYYPDIVTYNRTVCMLEFVCDYIVELLSCLNVTLMTVDRYVAIVYPFTYVKYGNSLPGVRWLIGAVWVYSWGVGWAYFFYNRWSPECYCIPELTEEPLLSRAFVLPEIGLGAVLMIVLYGHIFITAAKQHSRVHDTAVVKNAASLANQVARKESHKYARVIGVIVFVYLACWIPSSVIVYFTPFQFDSYAVAALLTVSNALLDPLVYYWQIREFRDQFRKMLRCVLPSTVGHRLSGTSNSDTAGTSSRRKTVHTSAAESTKF